MNFKVLSAREQLTFTPTISSTNSTKTTSHKTTPSETKLMQPNNIHYQTPISSTNSIKILTQNVRQSLN